MAYQISEHAKTVKRMVTSCSDNRVHLTTWEKKFISNVRTKDPDRVRNNEFRKLQEIDRELSKRIEQKTKQSNNITGVKQ